MSMNRWTSLALSGVLVLGACLACNDGEPEENEAAAGEAGAVDKAGSSGGPMTAGGAAAVEPGSAGGGIGPEGRASASASGEAAQGGAGGESPFTTGGDGGETAQGGAGGAAPASCDAVRSALLGPIDGVAMGLVSVAATTKTGKITVSVDASAGGFMAAASNPYVYVNLAHKARVDISDFQADSSTAWDLAFKRDNIRSNGGDSGPGQAQVAFLPGASFDEVTADAANGAEFVQDAFVDPDSCQPSADDTGKPITAFAGWYDYAPATMSLTPNDRVYLLRGANGTSLFKLKITGYYVDVADGSGGTVRKSAVFSLTYQTL